jgi:hypothetical protein
VKPVENGHTGASLARAGDIGITGMALL